MSEKTISFDEIHRDYCKFIDSCGKLNCFTRSNRVQNDKVTECRQYISVIKAYKKQAAERGNELQANQFFHMQCMINALISSLLMWVELKNHDFQKAWRFLVDAQEYTEIALKIMDYEGVRNLNVRLKTIEDVVFPRWAVYNSPSFVETIGECSICHKPFLECDHIENQIYMGRLCQRMDRKIIDLDHVAFVEDPRDKRCIITKVSDQDGRMKDYFTLEDTGKLKDDNAPMQVEAIVLNFSDLDFD